MRQVLLLLILLSTIGTTSCQQEKPWNRNRDKATKTLRGKLLYNHTNLPGPKVKPGEIVVVSVDSYLRDTLVASTKYSNIWREVQLPFPKDVVERTPAIYDAAQLMTEGDSATMWDPLDSLKLSMLPPEFVGETETRYEIKLHKVFTLEQLKQDSINAINRFPSAATQIAKFAADYKSGLLDDKLTVTPSGLKVLVVEPGGPSSLVKGLTARAHFVGAFSNGKVFDNSLLLGKPITFVIGAGQLIPGFDECVQVLKKGGKAYAIIPPALGFGEKGSPNGAIPPNTEIIYYIEVL
ncbi:MAG: FKBP-type peptidyl-prolyl cis-trans isomerase [Lewinellaceae bacterium]|nr:FKBP-type peptidyl-prolyl cis-trans isomerase [Lewinellaceae bacterium]